MRLAGSTVIKKIFALHHSQEFIDGYGNLVILLIKIHQDWWDGFDIDVACVWIVANISVVDTLLNGFVDLQIVGCQQTAELITCRWDGRMT